MSHDGLAWQRWLEPVDEFVREHAGETRRWAIACTYELDIEVLRHTVLPTLCQRRRPFRTVVLADAGTIERVAGELRPPLAGAVNLHPVRVTTGGVFHPKLLLLCAGKHVRVCFGSANLTSGGLAGNLELWTHSDSPELAAAMVWFLDQLCVSKVLALEPAARRNLQQALVGLPRNPAPSVWSSLQGSFRDRLDSPWAKTARRAMVVSPLYATQGGLHAARSAIPTTDLTLCTDLPIRLKSTEIRTLVHRNDQDGDDDDPRPTTLHAKAYAFEQPNGSAVVWIGSANFTAQALTKSVAAGGNVELMVRTTLDKVAWRRMAHDLEVARFEPAKDEAIIPPEQREPMPTATGTVLGIELYEGKHGPELMVISTLDRGTVMLVGDGDPVKVLIRNGQGRLSGDELRNLLPDVDERLGAATCFAVHELVGKSRVPKVVNVPHVPPGPEEGGVARCTLDSIIAEMMGLVPVYRRSSRDEGAPDDEDDTDGRDDSDNEIISADDEELEKRLDEVSHQGRLDQEAVKLAVIEKLVRRRPKAEQAALRAHHVHQLVALVSPHLQPIVRRLFRGGKA
jgi:hypothetical protein